MSAGDGGEAGGLAALGFGEDEDPRSCLCRVQVESAGSGVQRFVDGAADGGDGEGAEGALVGVEPVGCLGECEGAFLEQVVAVDSALVAVDDEADEAEVRFDELVACGDPVIDEPGQFGGRGVAGEAARLRVVAGCVGEDAGVPAAAQVADLFVESVIGVARRWRGRSGARR